MNRILVTGGAGFLGSNLCKKLVEDKNNYVIALDNLYTGHLKNIMDMFGLPNFEFIEWDIVNKIDIQVNQIYNAACPASPQAYQASPTYTTKTNVIGVINMLELAKEYDATLLQFSTSEVYGDALTHPQTEDYWGNVNPIGIRSCYDEGKRCAESLCFDYNREFGTNVKVVRIFNTYGENMYYKDGRVVSNFIIQALTNNDITIYGDGSQTRSFCYVSDLIDGIIKTMNSDNNNIVEVINLGNPSEFTMLELAKKIIDITDSKSNIVFFPLPSDDPKQRRPNISLAKEKLGWEPKISLDEGLRKTISYYKNIV